MIFQDFNSGGIMNFNINTYENYNFTTHFHKNIEFVYVAEGKIEITVNGITSEATKGQFAIILPYHLHSFRSQDTSETVVGVFSNDFVSKFISDMNHKTTDKFIFDARSEFADDFCNIGTRNTYSIIGILYTLCGEFTSQTVFTENVSGKDATLNRIMMYIAENLRSDISLRSLAESLGYDKHYISRLFNTEAGINFRSFINMCRTEIAREMLETTDKPITEIAFECGFSGIRTFNRSFREFSGCTPKEYRKGNVSEAGIFPKTHTQQ